MSYQIINNLWLTRKPVPARKLRASIISEHPEPMDRKPYYTCLRQLLENEIVERQGDAYSLSKLGRIFMSLASVIANCILFKGNMDAVASIVRIPEISQSEKMEVASILLPSQLRQLVISQFK